MTADIAMMSATELRRHYKAKRISPVEATRAVLRRIEARDGALNAFRFVAAEEALAAARESEARWAEGEPKGLVDGVPTTIKDQWLSKGWSTLRGSLVTPQDGPWDEDSPAVARLREHGAVFLGKTNMPEFGWKGVTDSPLTGISRNPWNPPPPRPAAARAAARQSQRRAAWACSISAPTAPARSACRRGSAASTG
jgi:aspartyl-tRNA(Asn)/glutamyl-tRNA(Gln) amidotransferase subunit A